MNRYQIAFYIRLSLEDSLSDSMSIPNQRLLLHEKAMALSEAERADIQEFVDNGFSGTSFERPAMLDLLDLVQQGKIDCIMVKDFSRFGRNSIETGYFIEKVFPLYHTRFISVGDDYDSERYQGTTGGIDVAFRYLINEAYSKDMSVKNRSAKRAKMKRGEYQSSICPYGYRKSSDGRMEPNEETAPVIRQIFERAAAGMRIGEIARMLTEERTPTPGEYRSIHTGMKYPAGGIHGVWHFNTINSIINDERYAGTYVMGKREIREPGSGLIRLLDESEWFKIPGHHPAIVEMDLFQRANQALHHIRHSPNAVKEYPLRGKVFCGYCGHLMGRFGKKKETLKYYCRHAAGMDHLPCHNLRLRASELEIAVLQAAKTYTEAILGIDPESDDLTIATVQLTDYEDRLHGLQEKKRLLYEECVSGDLSVDEFQKKKIPLDQEMIRIKNTLSTLNKKAKEEQEDKAIRIHNRILAQEVHTTDMLTQSLADKLIRKVIVHHEQRIEIQFSFQDTLIETTAQGS